MRLFGQRTIYGIKLNNAMLSGFHYKPLKNTTLNEKFNILIDKHTPIGMYPKCNTFVIGIGGNYLTDNTETYKYTNHQPIDASLFNHIPFILRKPGNDLTYERKKYRLRTTLYINGEMYIAYYGKFCNEIDYRNEISMIVPTEYGDRLDYLNTQNDKLLNPEPFIFNSIKGLDNNYNSKYVVDKFKMTFELNSMEQEELKNVYNILGLDLNTKITEIGIVFSHDTLVDGYNEICDAQIYTHITCGIDLISDLIPDKKFTRYFELGGAEPMLLKNE